MKKIFLFIFAAFTLNACTEAQGTQEQDNGVINKIVSLEEFKRLMKLDNAQVIDVRTPAEYDKGKIGNAPNIDFLNVNFETEIDKFDKNRPTLLYCASGVRSGKALQVMKELGFKEVYNLEGGYRNWSE
ncbi:MAG: rhodanese-like domain-containing protein [Crocinitomicaceae bacterium]|nr:rhodanese-like domain-containing protein [Crocinitomicaceae bacterium]